MMEEGGERGGRQEFRYMGGKERQGSGSTVWSRDSNEGDGFISKGN